MHAKHRNFHCVRVPLDQASAGGQVFTFRFTKSSEYPARGRYLIDDGLFDSLHENHGEGDSILDIHRVNVIRAVGDGCA